MTTVRILTKGLVVTYFNPDQNRGETAILRHSDHKLRITITRDSDNVVVREYTHDEIQGDALIEVVSNGSTFDGYKVISEPDFDRSRGLEGNNQADLQWILDLEGADLHNEPLPPVAQEAVSVTKMHITDALFYTASLSTEKEFWLHKRGEAQARRLGIVGCTLGALIRANDVELRITNLASHLLNNNSSYTILVDNREEYTPQISDFPKYYDVFQPAGNDRFDLFMIDTSGEWTLGGDYPCCCLRGSKTGSI